VYTRFFINFEELSESKFLNEESSNIWLKKLHSLMTEAAEYKLQELNKEELLKINSAIQAVSMKILNQMIIVDHTEQMQHHKSLSMAIPNLQFLSSVSMEGVYEEPQRVNLE